MHKLLCLVIVIFFNLPIQSLVKAGSASFNIELIHRESPLSPFYNHSITPTELLRKAALRSISRINHFRSSITNKTIVSLVIPNQGDYVMKLSIGTPPLEVFAIADTGSDLIWIQCTPCEHCYPQDSPIFNPKNSPTYQELSCNSENCLQLPRYRCGDTTNCEYYYSYQDESYTIGVLSTDTFSFNSTNGQAAAFPSFLFGCGHNNDGSFTTRGAGIVGLGGGPLSFISQLGAAIDYKFSYCLLPYFSSATSKLRFGQGATLSGGGIVSTPLVTDESLPTFYYLTLEGISVGDKTVQTAPSDANIIIDSGTTLTILNSNFYYDLEAIVDEATGLNPVEDETETFSLCYATQSGVNFPDMVFHFTGADLLLNPSNTFMHYNGMTCMLIVPTDGLSIFGNSAQVNFQVEYDLKEMQVSFAPSDCTKH